jgi:hypothetical protein
LGGRLQLLNQGTYQIVRVDHRRYSWVQKCCHKLTLLGLRGLLRLLLLLLLSQKLLVLLYQGRIVAYLLQERISLLLDDLLLLLRRQLIENLLTNLQVG